MADVGNFDTIDDTEIKNTYPPGTFDKMFQVRAPYRDKLRKTSEFARDAEGIVKFPLLMNGMWSVGITADNAAFPTPKDPTNDQGAITPVSFTTAIQVGLKTKAAAKSAKSTYFAGGTLGNRIESAAEELAAYINMVYCGSNRGRLAVVESDGSSNFVAAKPYGTTLLHEGMRLEAYTALSGGSARDSFTNHKITAIDHDTRTVTYVGAADTTDDRTLVAGDSVFITGTYAQAPIGLPDIVDDGTLLGTIFTKSRTTFPKLKGQVMSNGGVLRDVNQLLLMEACDRIRQRTNKKPTRVLFNRGQFRKLTEKMNTDVKFISNGSTGNLERPLGYTADSFTVSTFDASVVFSLDDHCTPRSAFVLSWDTFFLYEAMALDWISDLDLIPTDGGHKAGYLKEMASVENQGNLMPLANVRIDDLRDPMLGDS
jgi:hypothetical protein